MKVSKKTKNVRRRFFRSTRRKLDGKFGPKTGNASVFALIAATAMIASGI